MAENQLPEEVVQKLDPNRRKFILGVLAAGIAAPSVASFVLGKAGKSSFSGNPIRPASIVDSSGNFKFTNYHPSGNISSVSANFVYENLSGNFLRDSNGNFVQDSSGNLLCGTSGNIKLDVSGNAILSGNSYVIDPSGNWLDDGSGNIYLTYPSGNSSLIALNPSGNQFVDGFFYYDQDGVINFQNSANSQGMACAVSANHILSVPDSGNTTTTSVAPASTTTSAPASTTTSTPAVAPSGSAATTTAVPVIPVVPNGSIPATQ